MKRYSRVFFVTCLTIALLFVSGAFAFAKPVYKALIVGMDTWATDADKMKTAMLEWDCYYWTDGNIAVMKDPTGNEVLGQISSMLSGSDFFFFAYTGHGSSSGNDGNPETVPPALNTEDEWLCTKTSWISDDNLTAAFSSFNKPVLVALDSCHSGGFWDGHDEGDLEKLDQSCLYAACAEDKTTSGSLLWLNMINGCDDGDADVNSNNVITVQEWYDFSKTAEPSYIFGDIRGIGVFAIPEPGTIALVCFGLVGLAGAVRRKLR